MQLRDFTKEDAEIICTWLKKEDDLYRWSADRFNKFPLTAEDIISNYAPQKESDRFLPVTMADDEGKIVGHFIFRYPKEDDNSTLRFGFVIVDPALRGKGLGKEMLLRGIEFAKMVPGVKRVDLGVFENNPAAKKCYESVGFKEYGVRLCEMPIGTWKCIDMEILL